MPQPDAVVDEVSIDDLMNSSVFVQRYADICTRAQFDWMVYRRDKNGLDEAQALFKRGGRWFVHVNRFKDWILAGDG